MTFSKNEGQQPPKPYKEFSCPSPLPNFETQELTFLAPLFFKTKGLRSFES